MARGPQKPDHGGNFYVMPRRVLACQAWRHASLRARVVLDIFLHRHNGFNNGEIAIGIREIGELIGDQNHGANGKAVAELIELGFLECMSTADRHRSKTREYRITFIPTGEGKNSKPATHEYADWRPGPMQLRKFGAARTATRKRVSAANTATPVKFSVADTASQMTESRGFEAPRCVAVTASLIDNHSQQEITRSQPSEIVGRASAAEKASVPVSELRDWAKATVTKLGYGGQRELAQSAGIPEPALSRFRNGRGLPPQYHLPLQTACGRILPYVSWKEAA